jgi:hypothetical protein
VTVLAAFCAPKKVPRLEITPQRVYNGGDRPGPFVEAALGITPESIIYVSYNQASWARNL